MTPDAPNSALTEGASTTSTSAILGLRGGGNVLVQDDDTEVGAKRVASGGAIYTDMPALEEVLRQLNVITAVIERPSPSLPTRVVEGGEHRARGRTGDALGPGRIFVLGGLPIGTLVAGVLMMIAAVAEHPIVPNPYIALYLILAGVALGITAVLALRDPRRS